MTTALEGGEGSASRPGRFVTPGKTRYPLYRRLGGPQGRSGQVRKIFPPPGFDPRTVQPVASRYTHYTTRPTLPFDPRTVQPVASRYPAHLCTHTPPKYLHGEESENLPSFYGTQNSEHVRKIALMCPILMQTNPFRTLATCFDKILNFNIIPPSVPTSSK